MSFRILNSFPVVVMATMVAVPLAFASPTERLTASDAVDPKNPNAILHGAARADGTLGLEWLERIVLERNPTLSELRAAWRRAEAVGQRDQAWPAPRLNATVAPRSANRVGHVLGGGDEDRGWRLELMQTLARPGERANIRAAAAAEVERARIDLNEARLELVLETRRAYFDYYHAGRRQAVSLEISDLVRSTRKVALARYASGQAGQYEVLEADAQIAMFEHEAVAADRDRRVATARLLALMHFDPAQRLPPAPDSLPVPGRDSCLARLAARDTIQWPELQSAEAAVAGARSRHALARGERFPSLTLGIGYDRFMAEPEWRPMVTASLDLPFLSARPAAAVREARAALEEAEANREVVRDGIERRLAVARIRFIESLHEFDILRELTVPATERAMASMRVGYEAGRIGFGDLLRSMRAVLDARFELHRVIAAANLDAAELDRALAGPFLPPVRKDQP